MNWLYPYLYKTGVYCPCKHLLKFKLVFFHTLNMKIWWQLLTAYGKKAHNSYITDRMLHIEQYQRKSKQSVQWMANVWMYLYLNRSIFLSNNIQKDDFSGKRVLFWELIKWDRDVSRALLDRKQTMNPRTDLIS